MLSIKKCISFLVHSKSAHFAYGVMSLCLLLNLIFVVCDSTPTENGPANITCVSVPGDETNQDEFMQTTTMTKSTEDTYNACGRIYENEYRMETTQVDIKIRDGYFYPYSRPKGIMAVVQNIYMFSKRGSEQCLDYVQFSKEEPEEESPKTCGAFMESGGVNDTIGPMSFISYENRLRVSFSLFINNEIVTERIHRSLSVKLTSFYACPEQEILNEEGEPSMKRCSDLNSNSCIPSEYFCDGVMNCADFGEGIGWDEHDCELVEKSDNVTKVVIDRSSEVNLKDPIANLPDESTNLFLWTLLFVIIPIIIIVFSIVTTLVVYEKIGTLRKQNEDHQKLAIFLNRNGLTIDDLEHMILESCIKQQQKQKKQSCSGARKAGVTKEALRMIMHHMPPRQVDTLKICKHTGRLYFVDPNELDENDSSPTFKVYHV